jgi:two-component system chemotaxis response regulator CheY
MSALKRVLIVDDSSIICKLLSNYLTKLNFEIIGIASSGKEALALFDEKSPSFVTLDLSMPDMTGFEVLEAILNKDKDTKVVMISGITDKANGLKALKAGASSFIIKPFTFEKIKDRFEKIIPNNNTKKGAGEY